MKNRNLLKQLLLAAVVGTTLTACVTPAAKPEWWAHNGGPVQHESLLADKSLLARHGDIVKFWVAQIPEEETHGQPAYTKSEYAFDCRANSYVVVESITYDAYGHRSDSATPGTARDIEPGSKEETISTFGCDPKRSAWSPISNGDYLLHSAAAKLAAKERSD